MAGEIGPFGIGVSVLVTGTYATDSITDAGTTDCRVLDGRYCRHRRTMDKRGRAAMRHAARSPELFAAGLEESVGQHRPFDRRAVGPDARMLMVAGRVLPPSALHHMIRLMMGIPRFGRCGQELRTVIPRNTVSRARIDAFRTPISCKMFSGIHCSPMMQRVSMSAPALSMWISPARIPSDRRAFICRIRVVNDHAGFAESGGE